MNSPTKFQTLFKFPGSSIPSLAHPPNNSNKKTNVISQIPYSSLLPNIPPNHMPSHPITPHNVRNINNMNNINIPNLNNMTIPPPPSTFDVLSPRKVVSPLKPPQLLNKHKNNSTNNRLMGDDCKSFEDNNNETPSDKSETNKMTQTELINAIETEKNRTIEKTQKVTKLHRKYNRKLQKLKNTLSKTKQKILIIDKIEESQYKPSVLENMLREKQKIYNSFVLTQSTRLYDKEQLKKVKGQNHNLKSIVESLSNQLKAVIQQYQLLCFQQTEYHPQQMYHPDCSGAMGNNVHFREMLCDNRRLERQIKFLKHIIQKETARQKLNSI